jgi:alkylhydroperoxidase family enzyme
VTHIQALPLDEIEDPELRALVAQAAALGVPDETFCGIVGRVPEYAKALLRAMLMSHAEGNVDHRLKEIIRVQLARTARDPYFLCLRSAKARAQGLTEERIAAGSADYENDPQFSAAEKCALRYAERMYLAPAMIDAGFYAEMKRHFTEAQIMELGAFIAFHYGMQVFMRTLS